MSPHTAAVLLIFGMTYVLIAGRRLRWFPVGRTAGAMLGAVGMWAVGAIPVGTSFAAIDLSTILLLLSMMMMTAFVAEAGGFERIAAAVLRRCATGWSVLWVLSVLAGVLSALLVNDTVCVFLTPVVVAICRKAKLPMGPYLIALATSANIGSAATAVGNPQNMLIARIGDLKFLSFLACSGPAAALGLGLNIGLLYLYYGRKLRAPLDAGVEVDAPRGWTPALVRVVIVGAAVLAGFLANLHLGYTALAGVVALIALERRDPERILARVDWGLLVFFCGLFVTVAGLQATGLPSRAWDAWSPAMNLDLPAGVATFTAAMTAGAQVVSNVPMVLLVGPYLKTAGADTGTWTLLAFVLTVAGNLTLIGSVANLIVAESAREHYALGFREYLKFGLPSTLLVLAAGVPVVLWGRG